MAVLLIVDDDRDDLDFFCEVARELDPAITCFAAESGCQALELLLKNDAISPDYIFLDLNMPGMSGKQCLCKIKSNLAIRHVPVIIYTTSKSAEDMEETKKMGAFSFLTKPSSAKELKRNLLAILQLDKEVVIQD
jgi:CheY-like chemotaxis protein